MEKTRLISIDIAKAICIILVVMGHFIPDDSPNWYVVILDVIYTFHMPLFLFASGYVYWATRKPVKYRNFVWNKIRCLMIPCYSASIIIIIIKLLTEKLLSVQNPVSNSVFYEMFYSPAAGYFLWFIFALFLMFLMIPFFNTRKCLLILLVLSLVLFFIPISFPKVFCLDKFKVYLLYFVLGCILLEWSNVRRFVDKIHFLIAFCIFFGTYMLKLHTDIFVIKKVAEFCVPFTGIVFILTLSKYIELKTVLVKKILLSVSLCSYTIYLFHTTFEGFTKAIILKLLPLVSTNINTQLIFIFIAFIVIMAGVVVPMILHKIIIRYSRFFSFLFGAKFVGAKINKGMEWK